jgi:hypothetical protein
MKRAWLSATKENVLKIREVNIALRIVDQRNAMELVP